MGAPHPEICKVQAEGGVNPPLPRNCEGNETHKKAVRRKALGARQKEMGKGYKTRYLTPYTRHPYVFQPLDRVREGVGIRRP